MKELQTVKNDQSAPQQAPAEEQIQQKQALDSQIFKQKTLLQRLTDQSNEAETNLDQLKKQCDQLQQQIFVK